MEKRVYKDGITPTLDGVRARLHPALHERLRAEAGFDEARPSKDYPLATFDAVVKLLAAELFEGDEARLGVAVLERYQHSLLGKAIFPLIRLIGPMRFLKRVPFAFRQVNNFAEVTVQVTSARSCVIEHNEVGAIPQYFRGVLQTAGDLLCLPAFRCELLDYDGHRARFGISWR